MTQYRYTIEASAIDAIQYDGSQASAEAIFAWTEGLVEPSESGGDTLDIFTPDGFLEVKPGDWVVKDIGGFSCCKEGLFKRKFERAA